MCGRPGFVATRLHQAVPPRAPVSRCVKVAEWASAEALLSATVTEEPRELTRGTEHLPHLPGL